MILWFHKGKDGHDGRRGEEGKDGKDGATGPVGPAGPPGQIGTKSFVYLSMLVALNDNDSWTQLQEHRDTAVWMGDRGHRDSPDHQDHQVPKAFKGQLECPAFRAQEVMTERTGRMERTELTEKMERPELPERQVYLQN